MYIETWYKIICEKCSTTNWFNNGNGDDLTVMDIEGYECFHCKYRWDFLDEVMKEISSDIEYEIGLYKPK